MPRTPVPARARPVRGGPVGVALALCSLGGWGLALAVALWPASAPAADPPRTVSLELVLAIDVSASVDEREYRLQIRGLAEAFRRPEIVAAVQQHPQGVAVALVQWAGRAEAVTDPPWRLLDGEAEVLAFADEIEAAPRRAVGQLTAIGHAIDFSLRLIRDSGFRGRTRKIDVSGDGQNNYGEPAALARRRAVAGGVTVNGLAILTDEPNLLAYYARQVAAGPGAFVLEAASYEDFSEAITRKLFRELTLRMAARHRRHAAVAR